MKAFLFALHLYCLLQIHDPLLFSFSIFFVEVPWLKKKKNSFLTFCFNRGLYGTFLATEILVEVVRWGPRRKPLKWAADTKQQKHAALEAGSLRQGVSTIGFSWIGLSPWLADDTLWLCPHMVLSLCACIPDVSSPSYKDTKHIGSGPNQTASFELNHHFKDFISKYGYIMGC